MTSCDLNRAHVCLVEEAVARRLGYLCRLRDRLGQILPPDDPLLADADRAFVAVHALRMRLHYLSCPEATGGSPQRTTA